MTSRAVVPLAYVEQISPWPRILKLVGVFTLLYGGINLATGLHVFKNLWVLRRNATSGLVPRELWIMAGSSLVEILVGSMLVLGAVQVLRNHSYRFISLGLWFLLAICGLGCIVGPILQPQYWTMPMWLDQTLYLSSFLAFPLLGILILRQFELSEDAAISPSDSDQKSPWVRILKITGLVTFLFAAGHLGQSIRSLLWTLNPPVRSWPVRASASQYWDTMRVILAITLILGALVSLMMMASSALLLKSGRGVKNIIFGAMCLLVLWVLVIITRIISDAASALEYLVDNAIVIVFPAILLWILREYAIQKPEPAPSAAMHLPAPH